MILGLSQASSAILSAIACLLVLFIIVIFKKYTCQTQRLIVSLTLAVLLLSIGYIVRGFGYSETRRGWFCSLIAFFTQYSGSCILLAVLCLIIEMFIHSGILQEDNLNLEKLYFTVIFIVPAIFDWIPFLQDAYGPTSSWCWIRSQDLVTCDQFLFGIVLQYLLWFVPLFVVIVVGFVLYIATQVIISRQINAYTGLIEPTRRKEKEELIREIKQFRWYPLIFLVANTIPLAARIISDFDKNTEVFGLWVVAGIIQGLQGSIIALAFTVDPTTRRRLTLQSIRAAIRHNVLNVEDVEEYPACIDCESDGQSKSSSYKTLTDSLEEIKD